MKVKTGSPASPGPHTILIDGKPRRNRPTEYAETEKEAHELLKRLQAKHLMGDDMTTSKQTVESFLLRWLEHVKVTRSDGTYGVYETRCRVHIIPAIGGMKLRTLKTAHVQTMLDALADTLAPSTVKNLRATIIKALNDARKWGEVKQNVAIDTESRPLIDKRPPSLTDAQLDRLLDVISGQSIEPLVLVALGTGSRISECLGLLWAGVNEEAQELHITGAIKRKRQDKGAPGRRYVLVRDPFTKTRDQRTTHLSAPVAEALHQQWERQAQQRRDAGPAWHEHGLVFTDKYGASLDPTYISTIFKKIAKRAGLPHDFTFHSLRHSCATFLIKQGEQERTIANILGHKNMRTTERYGLVLPEVTRDALDKHAERLTRRKGAK